MTTAALIGATGLVGANMLHTLVASSSISTVFGIARRDLSSKAESSKLQSIVADGSEWPAKFAALSPTPELFFSGLATTRAAAGGFDNQYKIDHDMNLDMAKAAKAAGVKSYVLISAAGADPKSLFGYQRMKGSLEEAVKALDFDHVVIVRPGMILGDRKEARTVELMVKGLVNGIGKLSSGLQDSMGQHALVIARAAVAAGLQTLSPAADVPKVWMLGASDIIRLGRTEWQE